VKEFLGLIAVGLAFLSFYPYIRDIFKRKTSPHLFTYIIWSIVTTLAFFGQVATGAGPAAWTTGVVAVLTILVLLLSFKFGTQDIRTIDFIFLIAALFAIVPWWLTHDPTLSVIIATFVDVCAFFPTIRKTYNDPSSETLSSYVLNILRHAAALSALASPALGAYIYPLVLLVMNTALVAVIFAGRKRIGLTSSSQDAIS
jgi:hypothetical protein